jgi:hypothetical protein
MNSRVVSATTGVWLVAMVGFVAVLPGCGGGAGTAESPASLASSASPPAPAPSAAVTPSSTLSMAQLAAAERVVERLVAAVNKDRFTLARSLMVDPDGWWSLDDMKAIRSIRLERVTLTRVEGSDAVLLQTSLVREPPPVAGGPEWPNFMLLVRDASGTWRVAETATGP